MNDEKKKTIDEMKDELSVKLNSIGYKEENKDNSSVYEMKPSNKLKNFLVSKIGSSKKIVDELTNISAYAELIIDEEKMLTEIQPMQRIEPVLVISKFKQMFKVDKPSRMLNGKPVFTFVSHYPVSIQYEMIRDENRVKLKEKGYTSDDLHAKIYSLYVNKIFRKGTLDSNVIIIFILSILGSVLATILAMGGL